MPSPCFRPKEHPYLHHACTRSAANPSAPSSSLSHPSSHFPPCVGGDQHVRIGAARGQARPHKPQPRPLAPTPNLNLTPKPIAKPQPQPSHQVELYRNLRSLVRIEELQGAAARRRLRHSLCTPEVEMAVGAMLASLTTTNPGGEPRNEEARRPLS